MFTRPSAWILRLWSKLLLHFIFEIFGNKITIWSQIASNIACLCGFDRKHLTVRFTVGHTVNENSLYWDLSVICRSLTVLWLFIM